MVSPAPTVSGIKPSGMDAGMVKVSVQGCEEFGLLAGREAGVNCPVMPEGRFLVDSVNGPKYPLMHQSLCRMTAYSRVTTTVEPAVRTKDNSVPAGGCWPLNRLMVACGTGTTGPQSSE